MSRPGSHFAASGESRESGESAELTPLSERLTLLLVVRLCMASVVFFSYAWLGAVLLHPYAVLASGAYVGVSIAVELIHRLLQKASQRRWIIVVNAMLILDGLYIAFVLACSGQSQSPFIFLAYAHVVSVTLLVGFRTGLKITGWHCILLLVNFYLALAGTIQNTGLPVLDAGRALSNQPAVLSATALWLVAIITASFASLNERELRRRKGELTIIADLSTTIEQTRHPSEIMRALVDATIHKMNCNRAIALYIQGGSVEVVGAEDVLPIAKSDSLGAIEGAVGAAVGSGQPILVRALDAQRDWLIAQALPDAKNVSVIPLIAEGEPVGALVAEWGNARKRRVTRPMIDLLSNVAGRVALSLSNTFLLAEVQRLASVDGLTGLPNRRTFDSALERELSRSARAGQPFSLLMLDIDHFKLVNDNHGHQMGDRVLAESAAGVINACRKGDLPARYGGEEIVVIMANCPSDMALASGDRIRVALADSNATLAVTASAGVATFPDNAGDVVSLLAAADEALYRSKETGRNRTTQSVRRSVVLAPVVEAVSQ